MFLKHVTRALAAASFVTAALANEAPAPAPEKAPAKAGGDDLVCTYERPTGSNVPRRVCMTQAQRDQQTKDSQEAMRRLQSPSNTSGTRSSN